MNSVRIPLPQETKVDFSVGQSGSQVAVNLNEGIQRCVKTLCMPMYPWITDTLSSPEIIRAQTHEYNLHVSETRQQRSYKDNRHYENIKFGGCGVFLENLKHNPSFLCYFLWGKSIRYLHFQYLTSSCHITCLVCGGGWYTVQKMITRLYKFYSESKFSTLNLYFLWKK